MPTVTVTLKPGYTQNESERVKSYKVDKGFAPEGLPVMTPKDTGNYDAFFCLHTTNSGAAVIATDAILSMEWKADEEQDINAAPKAQDDAICAADAE